MSSNVEQLREFVLGQPAGKRLDIATSQYADSTATRESLATGSHRAHFDFYSPAQAVRSLIKSGLIEGESLWRYYEVRRVVDSAKS